MNTDFRCNFICKAKSDSCNILRQPIRVFFHNAIQIHSVLMIDFHGKGIGNPILLQENKSFPHVLLFHHLNGNFSCLAFTDSFDFSKALGFLLNNTEGIFPKGFHNPFSQSFPNSFNGSRTQIPFHTDYIIRRHYTKAFSLHLASVNRMFYEIPLNFQYFTGFHIFKHAYAGNFFLICNKGKHCVSVFFILIYNMVNITFYLFQCSAVPFKCTLSRILFHSILHKFSMK